MDLLNARTRALQNSWNKEIDNLTFRFMKIQATPYASLSRTSDCEVTTHRIEAQQERFQLDVDGISAWSSRLTALHCPILSRHWRAWMVVHSTYNHSDCMHVHVAIRYNIIIIILILLIQSIFTRDSLLQVIININITMILLLIAQTAKPPNIIPSQNFRLYGIYTI